MRRHPNKSPVTGHVDVAVAYLRVSTEDQHLGPDAQLAAIQPFLAIRKARIAAVVTDHVSGTVMPQQRPGIMAALEAVRTEGAGILVVAKRDRLARDVGVCAAVERLFLEAGARVLSADGVGNGDDPVSRFMATIVDGFAAYERALIAGRTKAALGVKAGRGELVGSVPYGYKLAPDGIHLEESPHEQALVRRARELRAAGLTYREVGLRLADEGHFSRRFKPLHPMQVVRILQRNIP